MFRLKVSSGHRLLNPAHNYFSREYSESTIMIPIQRSGILTCTVIDTVKHACDILTLNSCIVWM